MKNEYNKEKIHVTMVQKINLHSKCIFYILKINIT